MMPATSRDPARATTLGELGLAGGARLVLGPPAEPSERVTSIAVDSRKVMTGAVFVAVPGVKLDGAAFVADAVARGAVAVVATLAGAVRAREAMSSFPVPFIVEENPRALLAQLAAGFYGAQPPVIAAVTGTNGKTSTANFLAQLWQAEGRAAASFGTTGVTGAGFEEPLAMTTPEPVSLHALLARLAGKGCTHAAMEASSHGLAQYRLDGVRISAAGFTNLTRDHLDYHRDAVEYLAAKLRLFTDLLPAGAPAAVNADDPAFPLIADIAAARGLELIPVGRGAAADPGIRILDSQYRADGQRMTFSIGGQRRAAELRLIGGFQAENVALAAAMAIGAGSSADMVCVNLTCLEGVHGRMELVARRTSGAGIYVDYAHTPGALETAIAALRPHCSGRLIVVFGAGGDRDPGKRPLMGQAVAAKADHAIVTDDNPRSEAPGAIRAAVMQGCPEAEEIGDRAEAILAGVDALKAPGDCLLIAGKGHETGQTVGDTVYPFDDAEQARIAVAVLDGGRA